VHTVPEWHWTDLGRTLDLPLDLRMSNPVVMSMNREFRYSPSMGKGASEVSGYRNDGVGTAVALVNAVTGEPAATDDELVELLAGFNFRVDQLDRADGERLRRWARRLRPVFTATDQDTATTLLNGLLGGVTMGPHISDHGLGPHLHYAAPGAGLVDRVRANTGVGLAFLLCEHGASRLGVCGADGCERVYADVSRGPRRRYCSPGCLNRSSVAAFRARRATEA
jgi:CGNR zinc finger